jgi:hypothetical protein
MARFTSSIDVLVFAAMTHDKFCRFANDDRGKSFKGACFDCQRLSKARQEERVLIAQELEGLYPPPPPIDEVEQTIFKVIDSCINLVRGQK